MATTFKSVFAALAWVALTPCLLGAEGGGGVPALTLDGGGHVTEMLVVGPFPNPAAAEPGASRVGFDRDWLAAVGGEAAPRIAAGDEVSFDFNRQQGRATTAVVRGGMLLNWLPLFDRSTHVVAYGIVDLVVDADEERAAWLGSDDSAKVWLNGELVFAHAKAVDGREAVAGQDKFRVKLRAGRNRLIVKLEQAVGAWALSLSFPSDARVAEIEREKKVAEQVRRFSEMRLRPEGPAYRSVHVRGKGPLPALAFENPELAELFIEPNTLRVRWFDPQLKETIRAEQPGFYCAYAEAALKDGGVYRRVVPVFVSAGGLSPSRYDRVPGFGAWADARPEGVTEFSPEAWTIHNEMAVRTARDAWRAALSHEAGAVWLAEMSMDDAPVDAWRESPYPRVATHLVNLRRKVLGVDDAPRPLAPPAEDANARALRAGTEAEAGLKPGTVEALREAFGAWRDATGHGFVVAIARNGVLAFHEAFPGGKDKNGVDARQLAEGQLTLASRLPTASVTKFFCGVLVGRFLDQGLFALDDPVGKYLPDFPAEAGDASGAVTIRQLMNHTAGFAQGHHRYWVGFDGLLNPFLDNVARTWLAGDKPGRQYAGNGFGVDLMGKIMETITGKSAYQTMREGLFEPLGMDGATVPDFGYGVECTALDLAALGEMLRNEGAYNGRRLFSQAVYRELLPKRIGEHNPAMKDETREYGVGTYWMRDPVPAANRPSNAGARESDYGDTGDAGKVNFIFGENVYGHGAATSTVIRIAPDLNLVVAIARYTHGDQYDQHLQRCLMVLADGLAP